MIGMRAISGSLPIRFRKRVIDASESIIAFVHVDVENVGARPATC